MVNDKENQRGEKIKIFEDIKEEVFRHFKDLYTTK